MGLSSLPTPSEGVLTVIVVNTVMSIAISKQILNSILRIVGIRFLTPPPDPTAGDPTADGSLTERFRSRCKPVRFGRRRLNAAADCRVCLVKFEAEVAVDRLPCGHLFHRDCVERWLDYQHATCPLCRSLVLEN